ncbi:MAG: hypothetical protein ACI8PT_000197 [Gammaproteobacteria bacterium]|jgi:hypothetical protein
MTLRRRGLVGCGRRPTVEERGAYNVQACTFNGPIDGRVLSVQCATAGVIRISSPTPTAARAAGLAHPDPCVRGCAK